MKSVEERPRVAEAILRRVRVKGVPEFSTQEVWKLVVDLEPQLVGRVIAGIARDGYLEVVRDNARRRYAVVGDLRALIESEQPSTKT